MTFLFLLLSYFSVIFLQRLDPVLDEVAEEEEGEGFEEPEDQANQGKHPLTMSMKPFLCMSYSTFIACIGDMMMR